MIFTIFPNCTATLQTFFLDSRKTSPPQKAYFVSLGEGVKPRLSQALIRDARFNSNLKLAV